MAKAKAAESTNQWDERRETLVVETKTSWPSDIIVTAHERRHITDLLHKSPKQAGILEYVRCPTGLIRHITVTQADVDRIFDTEDLAQQPNKRI
jgi:hypothetical protein